MTASTTWFGVDPRDRTWWAIVVVAAVTAVVTGTTLILVGSDGVHLGVIPTLTALAIAKHHGKKQGDVEEALADNPVAAFVFGALTSGDTDGAEDMIDEQAGAYVNGFVVIDPEAGDSPEQFRENIAQWRSKVPELSIEVYDEVSEKEKHKTQHVAVRFVMSGSIDEDGNVTPFDFEAAGFVEVVDGKATEWRVVVDSAFLEQLLDAMGRAES